MLIKEALADIAEELKKDAVKVRTSMAIFIGGSYYLEDKKYLEQLRDKLKEEGFPGAFLMEEIDGGENDLNLKFHKIWKHMSQLNPLFLLFAAQFLSAKNQYRYLAMIQSVPILFSKYFPSNRIFHNASDRWR